MPPGVYTVKLTVDGRTLHAALDRQTRPAESRRSVRQKELAGDRFPVRIGKRCQQVFRRAARHPPPPDQPAPAAAHRAVPLPPASTRPPALSEPCFVPCSPRREHVRSPASPCHTDPVEQSRILTTSAFTSITSPSVGETISGLTPSRIKAIAFCPCRIHCPAFGSSIFSTLPRQRSRDSSAPTRTTFFRSRTASYARNGRKIPRHQKTVHIVGAPRSSGNFRDLHRNRADPLATIHKYVSHDEHRKQSRTI